MKRLRYESPNPINEDLKRVNKEQLTVIDSLRADMTELETTLRTLQTDHDRILKENQILRRAVTIQQDRHKNSEEEILAAQKQRVESDERIRGLEQVILSLRYHLQAQQSFHENDFMHQRPPDVF